MERPTLRRRIAHLLFPAAMVLLVAILAVLTHVRGVERDLAKQDYQKLQTDVGKLFGVIYRAHPGIVLLPLDVDEEFPYVNLRAARAFGVTTRAEARALTARRVTPPEKIHDVGVLVDWKKGEVRPAPEVPQQIEVLRADRTRFTVNVTRADPIRLNQRKYYLLEFEVVE